jgi:hypothetical protein
VSRATEPRIGRQKGKALFVYEEVSVFNPSLAGQLADEIYQHFTRAGWLRRTAGRAVEVTPIGRHELLPLLDAGAG